MIRTYGLFWHRKRVVWGAPGPGNEGALWGYRQGAAAMHIDFRYQRGVYALYSQFDLVYVGQVGRGEQRLLARLRTHRSDHLAGRWDTFSWFGMRGVRRNGNLTEDAVAANTNTQTALNIMEALAIAISEPKLNLRRGPWGRAIHYLQVKPEQDGQAE